MSKDKEIQDRISKLEEEMSKLKAEDDKLLNQQREITQKRNQIGSLFTANQGALLTLRDILKGDKEEKKGK